MDGDDGFDPTIGGRMVMCRKSEGGCGRRFYVRQGSRRSKCETCSPPRAADGPSTVLAVVDPDTGEIVPTSGATLAPVASQAPPEPDPTGLEARILATLKARGRHETVEGMLALDLARDLRSTMHTLSARTGATKAIAELVAAALKGAPREPDAVDGLRDEVAERRSKRRGA